VTAGIDLIAGGVFVVAVLWFDKVRGREFWTRLLEYAKTSLPVYVFFAIVERSYNFYRFCTWTGTYIPIFARERKALDPTLPANFPWSTPLHEGVLGALFKPEKSIFLFDPLLILSIVLLAVLWKRLSGGVRAFGLTSLLLMMGYITFYARYTYWAGDFAWGDRYVSTSVEIAALLSVPLLLRFRASLWPWAWRGGIALIAVSLVVQLASLAFWLPLEIYQMETFGHPTFVIALRFKNIIAFAFHRMDSWGLNTEAMGQDPWDYAHLTTWNFLPFVLRRVGVVPRWVVDIAFVIWFSAIAALTGALLALRTSLSSAS
jgi:hypothetical protein